MKKALALVLCLVMALAMFAGCGNKTEAPKDNTPEATKAPSIVNTDTSAGNAQTQEQGEKKEDSTRDTVRIAVDGDCGSLDPYVVSGSGYLMAMQGYAEPLWVYDGTGSVDYLLCESVDTISDTEYVLHLRKGVTFSNNSAFNADDVIFTWDYVMNNTYRFMYFQSFDWDKTVKEDDYTIRLFLTKPDASQFALMSDIPMIDKETYDADSSGTNPIGTGAYTVASYVVNSELVLKARDDYWGGKPAIENVIFKNIPEPSQKINAFEAGEVDFILSVPASDIEYLAGMSDVNIIRKVAAGSITLTINGNKGYPLETKEARWAVAYAMNNKGVVDVAYNGAASVSVSAIPVGCSDYQEAMNQRHDTYKDPYNMDKAKQYAQESGLIGKTVRIVTNGSDAFVTAAQILEQSLKDIGVDAQVINYDQATVRNLISGPDDWDIYVTNIAGSSGLGVDLLYAQITKFDRSHFSWDEAKFADFKDQGETILGTMDKDAYGKLALPYVEQFEEECFVYGICDTANYRAAKTFLGGIRTTGNAHDRVGEWYFTD